MFFEIARTHAIETPCVLELVFAPCLCKSVCFFFTEMGSELFRYRFGGQESTVSIECHDNLLVRVRSTAWRSLLSHCC